MRSQDILRKKEDFSRLFKNGKSVPSKYAVLLYIKNDLPSKRKAFLASKKVGNSVQRHRAMRLLREACRQIEKERDSSTGYDFLFIARKSILKAKCADVKKDLETALKRAKLI